MVFADVSMHTKVLMERLMQCSAVRYQNDALPPIDIPHIKANRGMILAQDNAQCHTAHTTAASQSESCKSV